MSAPHKDYRNRSRSTETFNSAVDSGEPIISTHDTKVWFIEYGGGTGIRVTFNPQSMVDSKGLDL